MEQQNELMHQPMLLTVPQVAKKLGLSRTTVYVLINREGLPVVRFGRATRMQQDAVSRLNELLIKRNEDDAGGVNKSV